jgi:hypothetical protein
MREDELRRLADEIAASYEARRLTMDGLKAGVVLLREESQTLMKEFAGARRDNAKGLREELTRFKMESQEGVSDLKQATRSLLHNMALRRQEAGDALRQQLEQFHEGLLRGQKDLVAAGDQRRQAATAEIEARADLVAAIREETRRELMAFRETSRETQRMFETRLTSLMQDLRVFHADLARSEDLRKKRVRQELKEMAGSLNARIRSAKKALREFQATLAEGEKARKTAAQEHYRNSREALEALFDGLHKDLQTFRIELEEANHDRRRRVQDELNQTAKDLRNRLERFRNGLVAQVGGFLNGLRQNRVDDAAAWREVTGDMGAKAPAPEEADAPSGERDRSKAEIDPREAAETPIKAVPAANAGLPSEPMVAPPELAEGKTPETASPETSFSAEAAPAEASPVEDTQPDPAAELFAENLGEMILDLLHASPEGLKMVEISEKLGLPNWRSLIPVMRELMDEEAVRKEETTYFAL